MVSIRKELVVEDVPCMKHELQLVSIADKV